MRRSEQQKLAEIRALAQPESSDEEQGPPKPAFNAFSLLNEDDDDSTENDENGPEEAVSVPKEPLIETVEPSSRKNKQKKKKKKAQNVLDDDAFLDQMLAAQKKELKAPQRPAEVEDDETHDFEETYDEIDTPQRNYDSNFKFFTTARLQQSLPLLSINSIKNLDPDNELRNLFGNLSLETIEDANQTTAMAITPEVLAQFKRIAKLTRGWAGKDRRGVPGTTRKLLLTRIKDDWLPTAQKPLGMEELRSEDIVAIYDSKEEEVGVEELEQKVRKEQALGVHYFKFSKLDSVQERLANTRFCAAVVLTPDPEMLMAQLLQNPYHAETLLQAAMVLLRQGGDKLVSHALIERCLFVFDRCFHKNLHELLMDHRNGLIRLPYEGFMNRQFYLCLFRYIMNMGERHTFLTAFSYCKFLFSLSPAEDPLGVRYFLDFYAIMSENYRYLTKLATSPLVTTYEKWLTPGIAFSSVLAHLHLGDTEAAKKSIEIAFQRHPFTAFRLLETVGLATSMPLKESDVPVNEEVLVACETYMVRAALLWKEKAHRDFLHDELTRLFREQLPTKTKSLKDTFYGFFSRQEQEKELPFNLVRFAILSGENRILAELPETILERHDVLEYDVLAPKDTRTSYDVHSGAGGAGGVTDSLFDHVDQSILASIIENRTQIEGFEDIVRRLQNEGEDEGE